MPAALVVGASRGLGLEFVRQYRAAGGRKVLTGLTEADNGSFFNHDGQPLAW